ncbi:hypothetical protein BaRGS_00011868 [Batillaria attramentaria]|uniref:Chromatin assembly factor 1 subunit A n=1 Tax=Batillaria attramentaria TaxID=370345 RepID=A0ABD0LC71_9CAEN
MSQCVERADKRPANESVKDVIDLDDVQRKKLKQARLPFQPLDCKAPTPSPAGSKKRKLSGQDSPNAKAKLAKHSTPELNHSSEKQKQVILDNDNEVSSSSEAENLPGSSGKGKSGRSNILERFVRRSSLQEEITSTNDVIDLTDSQGKNLELDENSPVKVKSPVKSAKKSQGQFSSKGKSSSVKDKAEEGFARKLVFAEDSNKAAAKDRKVVNSPTKLEAEDDHAEDDVKMVEKAKPTEDDDNVIDVSQEDDESEYNEEEDNSILEEKSEGLDTTTPHKQENKSLCSGTPSVSKEPLSCSTPRTPVSVNNTSCSSVDGSTPSSTKSKKRGRKQEEKKQLRREEEKKKKQEILEGKKIIMNSHEMNFKSTREKQKLKRKEAFESFFIKPKAVTTTKVQKAADSLFIPFEVKKDMSLAPGHRRAALTDSEKELLDKAMNKQERGTTYVECLKKRVIKPVRTGRKLRTKVEAEQDVELMVHDSETVKKVMHAVKLLQFHTDYRPPYYGTWRKPVKRVSPRNPWKKDEDIFDYEVDSDEEWEEEEPGESLSDSNVTPEVLKARQRAKAQAWEAELQAKKQVAPPVHLGCYWQDISCFCQRDLDILKQFEMVCLRTMPLETLISSPALADNAGDKTQDKSGGGATPSTKGFRKRAVPEEAIPDLIRLLHGNSFGIKKLIREFRLYWKRKTADPNTSLNESRMDEEERMDTSCADTSAVADHSQEPCVTDEDQKSTANVNEANTAKTEQKESAGESKDDNEADDNFCISKRQLEIKIMAIASRDKRPGNSKKCWYVHDDVLQQYNMSDLPTDNSWEYISCDMSKKTPCKSSEKKKAGKVSEKKAAAASTGDGEALDPGVQDTPVMEKPKKERVPKAPKDQPTIKVFACKTPQEKSENCVSTGTTQTVESPSREETEVVSVDPGHKPQPKPDQPSVLDFMKKKLSEKVTSSIEEKSDKEDKRMEVECIVLE